MTDGSETDQRRPAGRLIGVGVGPGDPELLTVKAVRMISDAKVIAYPVLEGADSFARSIAAQTIKPTTREIPITVPMTADRAPAQAAYDAAALDLRSELENGNDVVCLCEGDPFFYGSFMYLFARLYGSFQVEVVPGVTSVSACAARAGMPLVARNERLTILPGPLSKSVLTSRIEGADTVAIMKVGRHLDKIRGVIDALGLIDSAVYVERATLAEEVVLPLKQAPSKAPYFSMILIAKGADPWL